MNRKITIVRYDLASDGSLGETCEVKILQQWFRQDKPHGQMLVMDGEWRDVPLEIE